MKELFQINQMGLFPAPGQSDEIFWKKVEWALSQNRSSSSAAYQRKDLDILINWVPIRSIDQGLRLWEAAALWQVSYEDGFTAPEIEVSSRARKFYCLDEVMDHEMVHAVRSDFQEEQFEEVLAYATSKKTWRRFLGPFFRNPKEASYFVVILFLSIIIQGLEIVTEFSNGWLLFPWLLFAAIGFGAVRLFKTQRQFRKCLQRLKKTISNPDQALAVAVRLSDHEIRSFSMMKPDAILEFARSESQKNLRWHMLYPIYFTSHCQLHKGADMGMHSQ